MTSNTVSIATVLLFMLLERFSFWFVVVVKCENFSLQLYFLFIVVVVGSFESRSVFHRKKEKNCELFSN